MNRPTSEFALLMNSNEDYINGTTLQAVAQQIVERLDPVLEKE